MPRSLQVRCLLCGELLYYNNACPKSLIKHLMNNHPEVQIGIPARFKKHLQPNKIDQDLKKQDISRNEHSENNLQGPATQEIGKTLCPSCGKEGNPVIKRQKNLISNSTFGSWFTLGCWPLCFLPFYMFGNRIINMYCPYCSNLIGPFEKTSSAKIKSYNSTPTLLDHMNRSSKTSSASKK